jgi:hypothetical protein
MAKASEEGLGPKWAVVPLLMLMMATQFKCAVGERLLVKEIDRNIIELVITSKYLEKCHSACLQSIQTIHFGKFRILSCTVKLA